MPRSSPAARITFMLHTVFGLAAGVLLLTLGISGSVLIFRPELERTLYSSLVLVEPSAQPIRIDDSFQSVKQTHSDSRVVAVRLPQSASDAVRFTVRRTNGEISQIFVNGYTAQILGERSRDWLQTIHDFHHDLFAGRKGRIALGVVAWATVLLCISGGFTLWQRSRSLSAAIANPFTFRSAHALLGLAILPALLLIAFTATSFTWGKQYAELLKKLDGNRERAKVPRVNSAPIVSLDSLIAAAQAAIPQARPTLVRMPVKAGDPVVVRMHEPLDLRDIGSAQVFVDGKTNSIVKTVRSSQRANSARFLESFMPLHTGEFGGYFVRILWCIAGFGPAFLFVSGFVIWTRRAWPRSATRNAVAA